ncbi:ribosome maturation factor RimM, partial [Salmonella enterica]|uniref:ribosome maturation factor RimM n=1 Tax=Salmonella enterica TaxID=28901 RepID=UPI0018C8B60A
VCVARIGAAHGVRGAVKLWTFTEDPFAVRDYGPLLTKDGKRQFEVAQAREAKDHLVATFKGVTTRDEAERLNGIELYVPRDKLPATDEDEYYHTDLIGLRYNGLPSMEILGQAAPGKSTGEAMAMMEELASKLPSGIGYDWTGMSYQERLSGNQAPA